MSAKSSKKQPGQSNHSRAKVLAVLCTVGGGFAVHVQAQTLMDVYGKAQSQDMQYVAARKTFDAAMEKLSQARAALLPTLSLSAGKNLQAGEAVFAQADAIQRQPTNWSWSVQLTQPLLRWGNWTSYEQADAQVRQAQEQLVLAEQDLILRCAQSYLDVLLAMESVQVLEAQLKAMSEQWTLAKRNFEVGTGTVTDVQEAHAKFAQSQAQRIAAINELSNKQAELERIVGEPMAIEPVRLTQTLPGIDAQSLETWRSAAVATSPQVRMQQAALEVAQKEVSKNQNAHLPTLDLVLSSATNYTSGTLSSPTDLESRVNTRQVGLQLNVPLYAGGGTQSRVREALALHDKASADLEGARRSVDAQVRQAFAGVTNGQAQVEALQVAVQASSAAVDGNKIGYRIGTRINPDVLNAEQQLFTTARDLSKARVDTVTQGLKLKAAVGQLQSNDLAALELLLEPLK